MSQERLELVTDFAQLRAGMIVVVKPCGLCSRQHRGMLFKIHSSLSRDLDGTPCLALWELVPTAHSRVAICHHATDKRRVYRVLDGLEQSQTTTRKRERVK